MAKIKFPKKIEIPELSIQKTVRIKKKNASQVTVHTFKEIKDEIQQEFRYRAPNYFFHPLYKKRLWDGYIKLYNKATNVLPIGLVPRLLKFLRKKDYPIEIEGNVAPKMVRKGLSEEEYFPRREAEGLFLSLNLPKDRYQLRDDQMEALLYAIRYEKVMLLSATSSGKSLLAYLIIRHIINKAGKNPKMCALVVPTTNLVEQMFNDFIEYSQGTDSNVFDPRKDCHRIYTGMNKQTNAPVIISTWQSLASIDIPDWFTPFRVVIGDEAHTFTADSLLDLMLNRFIKAEFRIGMTGSLNDEKVHRLMLEGIFGPKKTAITAKQMIERGLSSELSIKCIHLVYQKPERVALARKNYNEEVEFITKHKSRHRFLLNVVRELQGNTIVMFRHRKHGRNLYKMFQSISSHKVFFVDGTTPVLERREVQKYTESHDNVIIVASTGVFSTGVNIRNLQNAVNAAPTKAKIKIIQSIGRILRKDGKGNRCLYIDIGDDLRTRLHINYAYIHFVKRLRIYEGEGHKYDLETFNIGLQ